MPKSWKIDLKREKYDFPRLCKYETKNERLSPIAVKTYFPIQSK